MLISALYIAALVIVLQSLVLLYRIVKLEVIDRILCAFLLVMAVDLLMMYIYMEWMSNKSYISSAAPFGLVYGPFLYLLYKQIEKRQVRLVPLVVHFLPFALAIPFYLYFISVPALREQYRSIYYVTLYSLMCLSWAIYPFVILTRKNKLIFLRFSVFKYTIVILLLLVSFIAPLVWDSYQDGVKGTSVVTDFIIALAMLLVCCLTYWYVLGRFRSREVLLPQLLAVVSEECVGETSQEVQSTHTNDAVKSEKNYPEEYKIKIAEYLALEKYFDAHFNLELMAKELNIPKSMISQYFALEYKEGFVKTINSWRIAKACQLLEHADLDMSMEELAFVCGFNSRASFYRNFNQERGCAPTVYRERSLR